MFYQSTETATRVGAQLLAEVQRQLTQAGVANQDMALTLLLHRSRLTDNPGAGIEAPEGFGYQGNKPFYPASVVKSFYLAAVEDALDAGRIAMHDELERAMRDMILWSSNNATNYIIDLISDTTGDTLLQGAQLAEWQAKRQIANRYFQGLGWPETEGINVCQKLMDDDRYGRERLFATLGGNNHNRLTSDATARLFFQIFNATLGSPARSKRMQQRFHRPLTPEFLEQEHAQVRSFLGGGLPAQATLYSKAGWNGWTGDPLSSYNRHDAVHVEMAESSAGFFRAFTLVLFSHGKAVSTNEQVFPEIGRAVYGLIDGLR